MSTTPNSIITGQIAKASATQLVSGTLGPLAVYTAGANGSKVFGLFATNTDTASETLTIDMFDGTKAYKVVAIATVIAAGTANATPAQALMLASVWPGLAVDGNGTPFIYLPSGWTLRATVSAVTAGAHNVVAFGQDF